MSSGRGQCEVGGHEINWALRRWADKGITQGISFLQYRSQASGHVANSVSSVCEMHFSDTYQAMWIRFRTASRSSYIHRPCEYSKGFIRTSLGLSSARFAGKIVRLILNKAEGGDTRECYLYTGRLKWWMVLLLLWSGCIFTVNILNKNHIHYIM